jgi:UDP-glucose 4-epimerase
MKAVVTGGSGFIGSHLVDLLLADGHSVTVIDNHSTGRPENLDHVKGQVEIIEADIAVPGPWAKAFQNADWVFHLAALADIVPSIQNPEGYFKANVDGTFNVLQVARAAEIKRFVYAASSSCYGIPDFYPTPETAAIKP